MTITAITDTIIQMVQCRCTATPFRHWKLRVEWEEFHPILSQASALTVVKRDDLEVELDIDEEVPELTKYFQELGLPHRHILDQAASHLTSTTVDESEYPSEEATSEHGSTQPEDSDHETDQASFEVCPSCGDHGSFFNRQATLLNYEPRTKKQAREDLGRAVAAEYILFADEQHVRSQIAASSLPEDTSNEDVSDDESDYAPDNEWDDVPL